MVRISSLRLWAYVQSFSSKFSSQVLFLQHTMFERILWRARETLVKQRHNKRLKSPTSQLLTQPSVQVQIKENIESPRHWPL